MPVTIYPSTLKIKDTNGTFHGADCIKGDTGPQGPHGAPIDVQVDGISVVTNDVAHIDISGKADKVNNATAGNFAGLDVTGNIVDSGKGPDDITDRAPVIVNSASGAVAAFEDGADDPIESLIVGVEPVQDLHGYDSPWPAGSTKNKMPNAIPKTETINGITFKLDDFGVFTVTGTATDEAICNFPIGFSFVIPDGEPKPKFSLNNTQAVGATFYFINNGTSVDSWGITPVNRTAEYTGMQGKTCDAYKIKVNSGVTVNMTISPMIVENSVTDYSYIPYSNVCPITGWTGAKVTRARKNLFDKSTGIQLTNNNVLVARNVGYGVPFKFKKGITYTISCNSETKPDAIYILEPYTPTPINQITNSYSITITPTEDTETGINFYWSSGRPSDATDVFVELGSTATAYEPYQGTSYSVTFPTETGTVYGGTLDVTNGTLTVDRAYAVLNDPDKWTVATGNTIDFAYSDRFTDRKNFANSFDGLECSYMDVDTTKAATQTARWSGAISPQFGIRWIDGTIEQVKADASEGKIEIVYELAAPITYTLTPQEVTTLLGSNRIWADCGSIAVNYRADTKTYVNGAVPVQDVQVNGTSILSDGVANVPMANGTSPGVVKVQGTGYSRGVILVDNGIVSIDPATSNNIKGAGAVNRPIVPPKQHEAVFYGLAKAAGDTTQAQSNNTVGTYTDTAKDKIQQMLGIDSLVARHEGTTASGNIAVGETFIFNGKLYSATSDIAEGDAIAPGVNCSETTLADSTVRDVQVNGTSVLSNGVANVPIASSSTRGVIKTNPSYGLSINENGELYTLGAGDGYIQAGDNLYRPITPGRQHRSVFYGLAKAAGDTTQAASDNAIGTYTDDAKTAIKNMLGVVGNTDYAGSSTAGIVKVQSTYGVTIGDSSKVLMISRAASADIKTGTNAYKPIVPEIQHHSVFYGLAKAAGDNTQAASSNAIGTYTDDAKTAIRTMLGAIGNTDYPNNGGTTAGIVKVDNANSGISISESNTLILTKITDAQIKTGTNTTRALVPGKQDASTFYGLAKAAGDTTQALSSNAVGTYTETAQSKIHEMLDAPVTVSGTDPVITGKAGIRYICGECDSLTLTPPVSGIVDVVFTSGTTPTVLSVPNTVKWPDWFNPSSLEASATYELNILDGTLGAVGIWT